MTTQYMHKRRKNDARFAKWFLLKFVLPIILTFVGTGAAGNYFVNAEIQRGWARWDIAMSMSDSVDAEEECVNDDAIQQLILK